MKNIPFVAFAVFVVYIGVSYLYGVELTIHSVVVFLAINGFLGGMYVLMVIKGRKKRCEQCACNMLQIESYVILGILTLMAFYIWVLVLNV